MIQPGSQIEDPGNAPGWDETPADMGMVPTNVRGKLPIGCLNPPIRMI